MVPFTVPHTLESQDSMYPADGYVLSRYTLKNVFDFIKLPPYFVVEGIGEPPYDGYRVFNRPTNVRTLLMRVLSDAAIAYAQHSAARTYPGSVAESGSVRD